MAIRGIDHIDLAVTDVDRSVAFYLGMLGPLRASIGDAAVDRAARSAPAQAISSTRLGCRTPSPSPLQEAA